MKAIAVPAVILSVTAIAATAQPVPPNGWGVYLAPTTCRLKSAPTRYERFGTNTAQDFGAYYNRMVGRVISAQIELRLSIRDVDLAFGDVPARASEDFLEIPFIVHSTVVTRVGTSPFRVNGGVGISYGLLLEQEVATLGNVVPPSDVAPVTNAGGYQKVSWIIDGGAVLTFQRNSGIFLSYRLTTDFATFGETDNTVIVSEYYAYGFQVGFEYRFGQTPGAAE